MNERIKELAKEAMVHMVAEHRLEDFAHRIVKECVEVHRQHNFHQRTQNAILEHFGIQHDD